MPHLTRIIPLAAALLVAFSLPDSPARAQPKDGAELEAKREKVKQRIRALRAWKLTEALDLDEKTAARLFPILNRYDEKMSALHREGRQLRRALRKGMRSGDTPDAQIDALVDRTIANQKRSWKLQEQRFAAVRKVLSPRQAAKILVVLPQIDRQIKQQIRRAMKRARRRGGKRGNPRLD